MLHLPSRLFAVFVVFTAFLGVISSPLTITPEDSNSSYEQLEQRGGGPRYSNVPITLMRKSKTGSIIRPDAAVTADEDWALFIGIHGFQAHLGPSGTLTASQVEAPRTSGGTLVRLQSLGQKASFNSAEEMDKVFQGLLTEVPALHKGVGVPQTNLAYLNGIFAYLATVKAVATTDPPQAWVYLYNEMHIEQGDAS
ncbi:hypothetical protein F5050DRAFT_1460765 [Lentinula boryana]|uniref:Uncharacterized protein n=1 Tax=Lentinula boryana TaxID=40481 RepID=A0ABQ8QF51_9AGAR|nr:hypothetical protein F5050DRAFT_1460765 [Lentinula boryana]